MVPESVSCSTVFQRNRTRAARSSSLRPASNRFPDRSLPNRLTVLGLCDQPPPFAQPNSLLPDEQELPNSSESPQRRPAARICAPAPTSLGLCPGHVALPGEGHF